MLILFTDTNTDITPEMARKYGYKLISMPLSYDGKTYYPYQDSDSFDFKTYYDRLRNGLLPTTSGLNKEQYLEYFEPEFAAGNDIFYVHFSAAMSGTFRYMKAAVDELSAKYPERKFYALDTRGISVLSLNILTEISDMLKNGKTVEEIFEWSKTGLDSFACYFFADDLKFFKRSGRCGGISAAMGNLLGVRPIIVINKEGKMVSIGKERGREKAINRLITYMEQLGDHIEEHHIFITHAGAELMAEDFKKRLYERFGSHLSVITMNVSPTSGAHCGPDAMAVCFHSVSR